VSLLVVAGIIAVNELPFKKESDDLFWRILGGAYNYVYPVLREEAAGALSHAPGDDMRCATLGEPFGIEPRLVGRRDDVLAREYLLVLRIGVDDGK